MPARDIVVVGGSAGGVAATVDLVRALPRDLPAAVFVALHLSSGSPGLLPGILSRVGALPAEMACDGAEIRPGRILVAPPDRHLSLEKGVVRLSGAPRVNRFRPSIDVLFRSAADAYGPRVAAVILSGLLDDGALGLVSVKQNGGIAIVQDTIEAEFTSMPLSALDRVPADHVLRTVDIATKLVELATVPERAPRNGRGAKGATMPRSRKAHCGNASGAAGRGTNGPWLANGRSSLYGCPDCGGILLETEEGGLLRFRCRIGHGYGAESLIAAQDARLEDALWTAVRALEEGAATKRRMASRFAERGAQRIASEYEQRADASLAHAATIREILDAGPRQRAAVGETGVKVSGSTRTASARSGRARGSTRPARRK